MSASAYARPGQVGPEAVVTSDDRKTYLVADWRDIDDGSFTLYFERLASGKLRLAIEQFNN